MNILQTIGKGVAGVGLFLASLLGYHQPQNLGATVYKPVPRYESSLALPLPAAQTTTMTMVSGVDGNGQTLSGPMCFTIDSGVAGKVEDVCGIASGTIVSALQRGTDTSGYNASSTLAHDHRVGADVKTTDSPYLAQMYGLLNGSQTFPNVLSYDPTSPSTTIGSSIYNIPSVGYVNSVASSGAPNASLCTAQSPSACFAPGYKGLIGIVTPGGLPTSTDGANIIYNIIGKQYYKSAYAGATTSVVMTNSSGFVDPSVISTSSPYQWGANHNFASTTQYTGIATTGIMIGGGPNATTTAIGHGATATTVFWNGNSWVNNGSIPTKAFASGTSTPVLNTVTTIASTTLPSATTSTYYHLNGQLTISTFNAANATATASLGALGICNFFFSPTASNGNVLGFTSDIYMAASTSQEVITSSCFIGGTLVATSSVGGIVVQSVNLSSNPVLSITVRDATSTNNYSASVFGITY